MRILPGWDADTGPVASYLLQSRLLPAKMRAFVDFIVTAFRRVKLTEQLLATGGLRRDRACRGGCASFALVRNGADHLA